jgi:hypothetical protein
MRRARLALLAATAAVASGAGLAGAAPPAKPLLTDPAGDARVLGAGYDIVSATLTTAGTTKKVGKRSVYTPKDLVASVTLAAPPSTQPGTQIKLSADTTACDGGSFTWYYTPSGGRLFVYGCGVDDGLGKSESFDLEPVVKGNTLTWTVSLKEFGADLPLKTLFSNFRAQSDQNDPATGEVGTALVTDFGTIFTEQANVSVDTGLSDATYKLQ